jgi:hypothetical protein
VPHIQKKVRKPLLPKGRHSQQGRWQQQVHRRRRTELADSVTRGQTFTRKARSQWKVP